MNIASVINRDFFLLRYILQGESYFDSGNVIRYYRRNIMSFASRITFVICFCSFFSNNGDNTRVII